MENRIYQRFALVAAFISYSFYCYAQDPVLPPTNLGMTNIGDGLAPPPGLYYNGYIQVFQPKNTYGPNGEKLAEGVKLNTLLSMQQLVYISKIKAFSGQIYFTSLLPLVSITTGATDRPLPSINKGLIGDLTFGSGIQWYDKGLFGKILWHRAEIDVTLPSGAFRKDCQVNASAHLYTFSAYYSLSLFLSRKIIFSSRNQLNYNSNIIGTNIRPGAFYNGNYSVQYNIGKRLTAAIIGYLLNQFRQDSFNGDHNYYLMGHNVNDTREKVWALGPALRYTASGGPMIEANIAFETGARNRWSGTRPTLRVSMPIN